MVEFGQSTIRGLDVEKVAKGYAEELNVFKKFLINTTTSAREIRWYQKTAGFLTGTTTTGITASPIANRSQLALPTVIQPNVTRVSSTVRKYIAESPWMSLEDLSDTDPDLLLMMVRDVTRGVENQVDARIYAVLSGGLALSGAAAGTGWFDGTNGSPILDLLSGSANVRDNGYDIANMSLWIHPLDYKKLLNHLIIQRGSSIPTFSSAKVETGVLLKLLNFDVVVSDNCTSTVAVAVIPQRVATWKTFMGGIGAGYEERVGIGRKFVVWEEGEILHTDLNAGFVVKGI